MKKNPIQKPIDYVVKSIDLYQNPSKASKFWQGQFISLSLILFVGLVSFWRIKYKIVAGENLYFLRDFYFAYYPAGHIVFQDPTQLYDFTKVESGLNVGETQSTIYGFVNLPIIAYLFTPFTWIGQFPSDFVFTLLGVASVILSGWLLIKLANLQGWKRIIFIVLLTINAPVFNSIWLGNSTHIVLPILIGSFLCLRLKKDFWSGALLAIAGLIKIPLMFPLLYFILRKRWQAVAGFFTTLLAIVGSSILICGWNLNLTWFQKCILTFSGKAVAGDTVQSVDSFLIRLLTDSPIDSYEYIEGNALFKLIRYGILLILIGGTIFMILRSRRIVANELENLEFSSFICLTLLISPISWTHYYLLLLLPIALYMGGQLSIPNKLPWNLVMIASIILVITPNIRNSPLNHPVILAFTRHFLVSHYFWGAILLLGILWTTMNGQRRSLLDSSLKISN